MRQQTSKISRKAKPPKPNFKARKEYKALEELICKKGIVILRATKRNVTVVMNTEDYEKEVGEFLVDSAYQPIPTDATIYLEKVTKPKIK